MISIVGLTDIFSALVCASCRLHGASVPNFLPRMEVMYNLPVPDIGYRFVLVDITAGPNISSFAMPL